MGGGGRKRELRDPRFSALHRIFRVGPGPFGPILSSKGEGWAAAVFECSDPGWVEPDVCCDLIALVVDVDVTGRSVGGVVGCR